MDNGEKSKNNPKKKIPHLHTGNLWWNQRLEVAKCRGAGTIWGTGPMYLKQMNHGIAFYSQQVGVALVQQWLVTHKHTQEGWRTCEHTLFLFSHTFSRSLSPSSLDTSHNPQVEKKISSCAGSCFFFFQKRTVSELHQFLTKFGWKILSTPSVPCNSILNEE